MAKQEVTTEMKELQLKLQDGKAVVGADRVLKLLKTGHLHKIFLARNCQEKVREDVLYYAKIAHVQIVELTQSNEELGVFCKKNFFVSVVGVE
jgi:ribosomal protein L30E